MWYYSKVGYIYSALDQLNLYFMKDRTYAQKHTDIDTLVSRESLVYLFI